MPAFTTYNLLEQGLHALAIQLGVSCRQTNWRMIIDGVESKLRSTPKGDEKDCGFQVNAQFAFLKDAYRNHSEHAHDDHYDIEKC